MVRNYAAIKLSVAITVISRELRGRDQMTGGTEVPIDKTERGGALDPRNGGTSAVKLRQVKSGKPRHLVFTHERRVPNWVCLARVISDAGQFSWF